MSRIEPRRGAFAELVVRGGKMSYGRRMESARVFAQHPRLMFDYIRFNRAVERGKRVPKVLMELAVLRAATMVGCEFCMDIGSEFARRAGLSDEKVLALSSAHESGLFSEDELLVIDLATGMTQTPGSVDEELMERARERFGVKGTLELVHMIAWENARARINIALGIAPEGFSTGKACAVPLDDAAEIRTGGQRAEGLPPVAG
ncbi:MAG TPA: carboxymuconolactone decarboxylase family protein [Solirubrobacterales bacterium]|nr:carboxymuconolactone decarboxylase family protein [Solirubrobacterales bacterium]